MSFALNKFDFQNGPLKDSIILPSTPALLFSAKTFKAGFMMALSAFMGHLIGLVGSAMSMMTTCEVSPTFSRTQMNLSLSMVREAKEMLATVIPMSVN